MSHGSLAGQLILQCVLIACNAIFACAEIAVISVKDSKAARLAESGDKKAVRLARLTNQPARFLATIQVCITLSGFLGSAFAADNLASRLTAWIMDSGRSLPEETVGTISVVVITLVLSYFTLVFGELVPKRIAMKNALRLALLFSPLIAFLSKVFAPVVWLLTVSTNGLLRLLRIDPNADEEPISEEDIILMIDAGSAKGVIGGDTRQFIENVFRFDDIPVKDIMIHRKDVVFLKESETEEEWDQKIRAHRHNRFPVCGASLDDVTGVLSANRYFRLKDRSRTTVMEHTVDLPYFVPRNIRADQLFRNMKRTRNKLAIVLDEEGGVSGILSIDDLLARLVGPLGDDLEEEGGSYMEWVGKDTWRLNGSVDLKDLERVTGVHFPPSEYRTFGGLVFGILGTVPEDGTSLEMDLYGHHVKITQIAGHRIKDALFTVSSGL